MPEKKKRAEKAACMGVAVNRVGEMDLCALTKQWRPGRWRRELVKGRGAWEGVRKGQLSETTCMHMGKKYGI